MLAPPAATHALATRLSPRRGAMARLQDRDPFDVFAEWFDDARGLGLKEPASMALATADADGRPSLRMVLLKSHGPEGFVFYTNLESRKARDIAANPRAALCFHWMARGRQVRIEGDVRPVGDADADAYFAERPRNSQIGAWASRQSHPMTTRRDLEKSIARCALRFALGRVPRPPYWSGYRVIPLSIEFWSEKPSRLHERIVFRRAAETAPWTIRRLFP